MWNSQEPLDRREFLSVLHLKTRQWVKDIVSPFFPKSKKAPSPQEAMEQIISLREER